MPNCPNCGEKLPLSVLAQGMGHVGGSRNTPAKQRASRKNGKLGGRPPKKQKGKP